MIQWFPGHMAKAFKDVQTQATLADLFIIVLDARAPLSTYNADFDHLAPHKPRLFVITKSDLGDQKKLPALKAHFNHPKDRVITVNLKKPQTSKQIYRLLNELLKAKIMLEQKRGLIKPRLRVIVLGVPNAGKSTLINLLMAKKKAQVANKPGVTRKQQWFGDGNIKILDTPGILWPKFEDELVGIKLAIIGSIKTSILPQHEVFIAGYKLLSQFYPALITKLNLEPAQDEAQIYSALVTLCENHKFYQSSKQVDLAQGRTYFINYLKKLSGVTYD